MCNIMGPVGRGREGRRERIFGDRERNVDDY
jgi:hypothetical protein